jgi:hypothetical protein
MVGTTSIGNTEESVVPGVAAPTAAAVVVVVSDDVSEDCFVSYSSVLDVVIPSRWYLLLGVVSTVPTNEGRPPKDGTNAETEELSSTMEVTSQKTK